MAATLRRGRNHRLGHRQTSFFISAHHDPKPGYGLLCVSGLGLVAVKAAYENGIRAGGTSVAEPGERRSYGSGSYSAFLKDPDGYEIEITVGSD